VVCVGLLLGKPRFPSPLPCALQERTAAVSQDAALSSFKDQLAFALHVLTLMATFFGVGFWLSKYVTDSIALVHAPCGCQLPVADASH